MLPMLVFWNPQERRLRALWRLLVQLALVGILIRTARGMLVVESLPAPFSDPHVLRSSVALLGILTAGWLAARFVDRRAFADFGLRLDRAWWIDFGFGLALGASLMGGIFATEWSLGWVTIVGSFHNAHPEQPFVAGFAVRSLLFLLVAVLEEFESRGYQLRNLAEGLHVRSVGPRASLAIAWLLSSAVFGLGHAGNPNATAVSTLGVGLAGVLLGLGFVLTGRLALPMGLHLTWNLFQGNVFGFPVSGLSLSDVTVLAIHQAGPERWTGGPFGPEAGLVGIGAELAGSALIVLWVRWRQGTLALDASLALFRDRRLELASTAAVPDTEQGAPPTPPASLLPPPLGPRVSVTLGALTPPWGTPGLALRAGLALAVVAGTVACVLSLPLGPPALRWAAPGVFLAALAATVVHRLTGRPRPAWTLAATALATALILATPFSTALLAACRQLPPLRMPSFPDFLSLFLLDFVGGGLVDEFLKAIPLLALLLLARRGSARGERIGLRGPLDGIALGAASGLGFAVAALLGAGLPPVVEGVRTGLGLSGLGGVGSMISRTLGPAAGHVASSAYFGYFLGLEARFPSTTARRIGTGYLAAAALHALWNAASVFPPVMLAVAPVCYVWLAATIIRAREISGGAAPGPPESAATEGLPTPALKTPKAPAELPDLRSSGRPPAP